MDYGLYLFGRYVGCEERITGISSERDSRAKVIGVATGVRSVAVYCDHDTDVSGLKWGDEILVRCRAYVGRNGALGYSGGQIVEREW